MRGHELTTRSALFKDELNHPRANEEYFKIQLGNLIRLPSPISADHWRRITFLYTTGGLLLRAETVRDMVVDGEERDLLWNTLRERAANFDLQGKSVTEMPPEFEFDMLTFFAEWDKIKDSDSTQR
jgi:hypothetical protein